ncbi:MAG: AAA family ATPase [Clostridia bacterium]|nr:AAA family ATPase [Clostridia bacterium]
MDIARAKEEIKNTVRIYLEKKDGEYVIPLASQRPVLLIGAPGIGKTAIMSEAAKELGIGFVSYTMTHHTRQSAIGLPYITKKNYGGREYQVTEYTMSEIVASVYEQGEKNGILFIDEINCVSETLAPAMLELLQHKKFGPHSIPDGWVLVAAGNPEEYNKSATELDMVTLDRVKKISVEPDYKAFEAYAEETEIHGAVTAFLKLNKGALFSAERTADGYSFVTPRGWEDLSRAIASYERLSIAVTKDLVSQYVQSGVIAADFYAFYKAYGALKDLADFDKIESGEIKKADMDNATFGERFTLAEIIKRRMISVAEETVFLRSALLAAKNVVEKGGNIAAYEEECKKVDANKKSVYKSIRSVFECDDPLKEINENIKLLGEKDLNAKSRIENLLDFLVATLGTGQETTAAISGTMESEGFLTFVTEVGSEKFYAVNAQLLAGGNAYSARAKEVAKKFGIKG